MQGECCGEKNALNIWNYNLLLGWSINLLIKQLDVGFRIYTAPPTPQCIQGACCNVCADWQRHKPPPFLLDANEGSINVQIIAEEFGCLTVCSRQNFPTTQTLTETERS